MKLNQKLQDFLNANKVWAVATCSGGVPHVVECYHTKAVDDETLVISAVFLKTTLKNVEDTKKVAITVSAPLNPGFEGYQVIGDAHLETQGPLYDIAKELVGEKPIPYQGALVIKVTGGTVTSPGPNVGKSLDEIQW